MLNLGYFFLCVLQYGPLPLQILSLSMSVAVLLFLIFSKNKTQTFKAIILSTIFFDDLSRTEAYQLINIHTISFMSLSILEVLTFLAFFRFGFISHKIQLHKQTFPWIILLFIGLLSSILNSNFLSYDKYLIKILTLILLISGFNNFFKKNNPKEFFNFFILVIGIKSLVNIILAFSGLGVELADGLNRGNYATSKNLMHIPIVAFTVSLFMNYKKKNLPIYAFLSTVAIFSYSSRSHLVLTFFVISLIILRYGIFTTKVNRLFKTGFFFVCSIAAISIIFNVIFPGLIDFTSYKLTTIFDTDLSQIGSPQVRIFEIINIYFTLLNQNSILYGVGWGGYFTDSFFPFMNLYWEKSTYPLNVFETGKIYHPHGMFIEVFLKTGILGFTYYLLYNFKFILKALKKSSSPYIIIVSLSIIPILYKFNSYITIFSLAFLIAFYITLTNVEIKNEG